MNTTDERLRGPTPECCQKCVSLEMWVTAGVERRRCCMGYPMHEDCGWYRPPAGKQTYNAEGAYMDSVSSPLFHKAPKRS